MVAIHPLRPVPFGACHLPPQGGGLELVVTHTKPATSTRNKAKSLRKNMTDEEKSLWYDLREFKADGLKFRKQAPIGHYIVDFVCLSAKLVVEIDGIHHGDPDQLAHDKVRDAWLKSEGFQVLRFWNDELKKDKNLVLNTILQALPLEGGGVHSVCQNVADGGGDPTFKPERSED